MILTRISTILFISGIEFSLKTVEKPSKGGFVGRLRTLFFGAM